MNDGRDLFYVNEVPDRTQDKRDNMYYLRCVVDCVSGHNDAVVSSSRLVIARIRLRN